MLLCSLVCLVGCDDEDVNTKDYTLGRWYKRANYGGYARSQACSFTIGNKGYMCSGFRGESYNYLNDLWEYDMDADSWTQLASLPDLADGTSGGRYGSAAFALDDKGYVAIGYAKNDSDFYYRTDTWQYDPSVNTWTQQDDFIGDIRTGATAFSIDQYGYLAFGLADTGYSDKVYRFNPNAGAGSQWTEAEGFPGNPRSGSAVFVIDNQAYVCGGSNQSGLVLDFYKYDGHEWTYLHSSGNFVYTAFYDDYAAPVRYGAVGFAINGYGYLATGYNRGALNDYWKYDPQTDTWYGGTDEYTTLSDVYNSVSGYSCYNAISFSNGERGFLLTGVISGNSYSDDIYELLPDEQTSHNEE